MIIKKKNRKYSVKSIKIKDVASIFLENNEQITLMEKDKNFQYDICKKNWGYYALPSLNSRLKKFKLSTFIINDKKNKKIFIHLVKKNKLKNHLRYIKSQKMEIINWPKIVTKIMKTN